VSLVCGIVLIARAPPGAGGLSRLRSTGRPCPGCSGPARSTTGRLASRRAALDAPAGPFDDLRADRASYTPFALLALHGTLATAVLVVAWAGALGGVIVTLLCADRHKWVSAVHRRGRWAGSPRSR